MMIFFMLFVGLMAKSNPKCSSAYCSTCDATKCTGCIDNFILVNGECKYCREAVEHCQYARRGVCTECFDGYYLKNGRCEVMDPHCDEYENGVCDECDDGYTLVNGQCVACNIKGCEECSRGVDTCTECIDGYVLQNNQCVQPIANCDEYNERTKKCEECMFGYHLQNGECVKISEDNCRKMQDGVCIQCFGPYIPINGTCSTEVSQVPVIEHCIEYDEDGEFECEECEPGYYVSRAENECLKCDPSCKTCDDKATECETCAEGFYVNNLDKCVECTIKSETCADFKSKEQCYQCNHKCNWYNNACVESHCSKYEDGEDDPMCVRCEEGYVLATSGRVKKDDDDDDDDDEHEEDEYEASICVKSDDGCKTKENNVCVECAPGYFITADFKCEKCSENCRTCVYSATNCHSCFNESSVLSEATCTECTVDNCISCPESNNKCAVCSGNYTVGDLGDCIMGCFSADCDGKCTMCNDNQDQMNIYYPPTTEGVCLKYSQMPNTPAGPRDSAYPLMIFVIALVFFLI